MKYTLVFSLLLVSCSQEKKELDSKIIFKDISERKTYVPYGPNVEIFESNCMTCHSLSYIEMQPNFSKKNWEKIVDKMIHSFNAPISDSNAVKIVEYLVSTKGVK